MKIRIQFILTIFITGIILIIITASVIIANQKMAEINKQVEIASSIQQHANDLGYLANDYLLYKEKQQLSRWESRFLLLSSELASLKPETPEQQALLEYIKSDQQRMEAVFDDIRSNLASPSQLKNNTLDMEFIRISWDRIKIQSQSIISNALQLTRIFQAQENQVEQINVILMITLAVFLVGSFIVNYIMINNRLLKTISDLQESAGIIGSGNLDHTIQVKGKDEISDLSNSFNIMTSNLKKITASKEELEREINERMQAEKSLKESEEKYRFLFEKMSQPFILGKIIYDNESKPIDFVYLEVNKTWEETMGFSKDKVIGKRAYKVFPELDLNWIKILGEVVAKNLPITTIQFLGVIGKWFNIISYPQKEDRFAAILEDITQQKIQEERILSLSKFPSENPNPVLRVDNNLKLVYSNKPARKILKDLGANGTTIPKVFFDYFGAFIKDKKHLVTFELKIGKSFYEFTLVAIKNNNYFNIYGRDITDAKKAVKIKIRTQQDRILELERKKIARELHDTVSQNLFSSNLLSESISKSWDKYPEKALKNLKLVRELNSAALSDIRILLGNLMPERILKENLKELIGRLLDTVKKYSEIKTDLIFEGGLDISNKMKLEVYRIAQESLNNIVKHSKATLIEFKFKLYRDEFKMVISDNGRGFDLKDKSIKKRFGLNIMKERAKLIGASLNVDSSHNNGTIITLVKKK